MMRGYLDRMMTSYKNKRAARQQLARGDIVKETAADETPPKSKRAPKKRSSRDRRG
jgi:hypothetical protein